MQSPLFVTQKHLDVRMSSFHNFFGNVFYNNPSAKLFKVSFNKMLSTPFVHLDGITVSYRTYYEPVPRYEFITYSIEFDYCVFIDCKSDSKGGAIYILTSSTSGKLYVYDSFFTGCSAKIGGGIYCDSKYLIMKDNCVERCNADEYEHFLYGRASTYRAYLNYSTIFNCGSEGTSCYDVLLLENSKTCFTNDNISYNHVFKGVSGMHAITANSIDRFYLYYSNVMHNVGGSMFFIDSPSTTEFIVRELSFENNTCPTGKYLFVCRKYKIEFNDCVFVRNYGDYFEIPDRNVQYEFEDCVFDIPNPNVNYILDDDSQWNTFNRTVDCHEFLETRSCYSQYTGLKSWQIVVIILASVFLGIPLLFALIILAVTQPRWLCPCVYSCSDDESFCCCNEDSCCGCCDRYCCECCDNDCGKACFFSRNTIWESCCRILCCYQCGCGSSNGAPPIQTPTYTSPEEYYEKPAEPILTKPEYYPSEPVEPIPQYGVQSNVVPSPVIAANPYDDPTADQ